jgi:hypothetical protein
MKPCPVCDVMIHGRSKLCPRCKQMHAGKNGYNIEIEDLRAAFDRPSNCFRCSFSHVCLDEKNRDSPYYRWIDHYIPGKKRVVLTCRLFDLMKSSLTGPEFLTIVPELDDHHLTKRPFNRDVINFETWNRLPAPPVQHYRLPPLSRLVNVPECIICGLPPIKYSYYCARCRKLVFQHGTAPPRVRALRDAYCRPLDGFLCYYTGIKLDLTGRFGPWHISLDHRTPGDENSQVVAALWVNRMKTFLTEAQFWAVIHSLTGYIRNGTPFDRSILTARDFARQVRKVGANNLVAR